MHAKRSLASAARLERTLSAALDAIKAQGRHDAVPQLGGDLQEVRKRNSPTDWRRLIDEVVRVHPIMDVLQQDPMAYRCFFKPRGYAGDAVLLDLIYRHPFADPLVSHATLDGRLIFECTVACPGPQAVRHRRKILAEELDRAATSYRGCSVLSLACGHLRELERCDAIRNRAFSRFVAIDQDKESLSEVDRQFSRLGVESHAGSVKRLLATPEEWRGSFDFIYAAGLYDYLSDRFAERLTASIFSMLKPGGRLLIANFLTNIEDQAYLESVMDWWLLYRTPDQIQAFLGGCPASELAGTRLFMEPNRNIAFLEASRC
jgi:extracellular factor (EF) 3-hydroxypalmitic acid methyl ester biosynthesis protein